MTGWARPSDQEEHLVGAFLTFLAAGFVIPFLILVLQGDYTRTSLVWMGMLLVGVVSTTITLARGREARKNLVKHVGLPPSILAEVARGALGEASLQATRLQGPEAMARYGKGCLEAFVVEDILVRIKLDTGAAGPLGSDRFGIFMGPATPSNERTLSEVAWHIERALERRRNDEGARRAT